MTPINLKIIKNKRIEKGISLEEMANLLGLANGSVYYKREKGHYKFRPDELPILAHTLDCDIVNFFEN
ncbi:helix-turn-helix transcriptional regulator [Bacillus sp. UNCCL81]|uniref:helix-turn-helix domain-containing protein n=1 Tax=Bacillus sp. UNCCL81 TaxID=1502755 RepID=UPI0008EA480F|nr:helix-turn-helix transcriptional regulator [Bacillus sp. UNCCL81]SFC53014.1 Helix-turn-helix domain-containing protein [Bacillus sp. UNCCL81]